MIYAEYKLYNTIYKRYFRSEADFIRETFNPDIVFIKIEAF